MKIGIFIRKKKNQNKRQKYSLIKTKLISAIKPVHIKFKNYFRIMCIHLIFSFITAFFIKITPSWPAKSKFCPPEATSSHWNRNFKVAKCCLDDGQQFSTWFLRRCGGGGMSGGLIVLNYSLGIIHRHGIYCCWNEICSSRHNYQCQYNFFYSGNFL